MSSRHTIREALPDGTYHVTNRGVERRHIFLDHHDYQRFKTQIKNSLASTPGTSLWAYSLMPNHFHLLIHQADEKSLAKFMQRLSIGYAMYFNHRYKRVGPLFQGKYRAVRIIDARQLMEVARYIHLNPDRASLGWRQHQHSSKQQYINAEPGLANPEPVLQLFDMPSDFQHYLSIPEIRSERSARAQRIKHK